MMYKKKDCWQLIVKSFSKLLAEVKNPEETSEIFPLIGKDVKILVKLNEVCGTVKYNGKKTSLINSVLWYHVLEKMVHIMCSVCFC